MASTQTKVTAIEPGDLARSEAYGFLAILLAEPANADFLLSIRNLQSDNSLLGNHLGTLSKIAGLTSAADVEREYNRLFIGLGRGELLPYASYYLTGFLNEKPLANLRADMKRFGIQRSEDKKEPEDHIASLMEMMSGMIVGRFGIVVSERDQQKFYQQHIAPWAGLFFQDLKASETSVFFSAVGALGLSFMDIEEEAFRLAVA